VSAAVDAAGPPTPARRTGLRVWGRRSVVAWLLLGLAIREALSFWTGQQYDFEVWIRNAYWVGPGVTPYQVFLPAPHLSFAYLTVALPSVGFLPLWTMMLVGIYHGYLALPWSSRWLLYFLLKQPEVWGDVLLGYLLYRFVLRESGREDRARGILAFWMLFPYPIIIGAMWGQFDSLVTAFWIAALLAEAAWARGSLLGTSIFLKFLPLIALPYYLVRDRVRGAVLVGFAVALPILGTAAFFLALHWSLPGFEGLVNAQVHGNSGGMTYASLLESTFLSPYLEPTPFYTAFSYLWIPVVLGVGLWAARRFSARSAETTVQAMLLILIAYMLTRQDVYEQIVIYLLVFLLLDCVLWHPERRRYLAWVTGVATAYLLVNQDLLLQLLGPLTPTALTLANSANGSPVLGPLREVGLIVLGLIFTAVLLWLAWEVALSPRGRRGWTPRTPERGSAGRGPSPGN
jgi:hypothetical protein